MISVIVPFIDTWEITERCIEVLAKNTLHPVELLMIDNGSDKTYESQAQRVIKGGKLKLKYVKNPKNVGVLPTFEQGVQEANGDILCFIHSDVLIHETGWDERVEQAFAEDPQLGLAGLFGARGVHPDGGREGCMSHMLGAEWGKVEGAQPAALHHGELMTGIHPATVFDGVGLFFRKTALQDIASTTDIFATWRAPHHFYDRILGLKIMDKGYHMAVIGIQFDHYSGATVNHSQKYVDFIEDWCAKHDIPYNGKGWDDTIYWLAEKQWREEYAHRLPVRVDFQAGYDLRWGR